MCQAQNILTNLNLLTITEINYDKRRNQNIQKVGQPMSISETLLPQLPRSLRGLPRKRRRKENQDSVNPRVRND